LKVCFVLLFLSRWSLGIFVDPLAQGATVKYFSQDGIVISLLLSGRIGERNYETWDYIDDTSYCAIDTIAQFHWLKSELRVEHAFGMKNGVQPYLAIGASGNLEKAWLFKEDSKMWESYQYKTLGGLGGVGLYVYPASFLNAFFNKYFYSMGKMKEVEDNATIQLELLNFYYRKRFGDSLPVTDFLYEYNYAGLGMGIGFYYNF